MREPEEAITTPCLDAPTRVLAEGVAAEVHPVAPAERQPEPPFPAQTFQTALAEKQYVLEEQLNPSMEPNQPEHQASVSTMREFGLVGTGCVADPKSASPVFPDMSPAMAPAYHKEASPLPLPEPQVADRKTGGPFLPPVPTRVNYALRMEQRTRQAISELNARAEHGPAGHGTATALLAQPLAIKARERLTPISDNAAGQQLHHQQLEVADLSMGKLFAEFPRRMILVCVPWE